MAEPMTPGECAYAAYHQGAPLPWALLPTYERQNWEAAAQAVLDAAKAQEEHPHA